MVTPKTDIELMAEEFDIDIKSIFHFIILGGDELIGEVMSPESDSNYDFDLDNQHLLINPIKIIRDLSIHEEDGSISSTQYFTDWNPCADGPYAPINSKLILSQTVPNEQTLRAYLHAVHVTYYPMEFTADDLMFDDDSDLAIGDQYSQEISISFADPKTPKDGSNVIDFSNHFLRIQRDTQ